MRPPRYSLELIKGTTHRFRFEVRMNDASGALQDLTGWSFWAFTVKRRTTDDDLDAIFNLGQFAGIEIIDAEAGLVEVTIGPEEESVLAEGRRHNLYGEVRADNADFDRFVLMTFQISVYPRIRQSAF